MSAAQAKDLPPKELYRAMLEGNKDGGWVSFRNIDGKQILYFSALQTLHCRLSEIRYSINSKNLDKTFNIVPCNSQNPWALPPDSKVGDIAILMPLGTAQTVAVQAVWDDGEESDVVVYKPCDNVGDQTCVDFAE
jgi:hypothetical protein